MTDKAFILGQPQFLIPVLVLGGLFAVLLIRAYLSQTQAAGFTRFLCIGLKLTGFGILAFCLLEPLIRGTRPTPGENVFVVLADQSQSLNIRNQNFKTTRGDEMLKLLQSDQAWQVRLAQDFETRRYWVGTRLQNVDAFTSSEFKDAESRLKTALQTVGRRLKNKPVAGVLLFTDGNATDMSLADFDLTKLPPIYPVVLGNDDEIVDLDVGKVTVTQSNFEAAPVRISAKINSRHPETKVVLAELLDEQGELVDQQKLSVSDSAPVVFKIKPDQEGIRFYSIAVTYEDDLEQVEKGKAPLEGTLQNNSQTVVVDRGGGPYRVLYVSGRPNWNSNFSIGLCPKIAKSTWSV